MEIWKYLIVLSVTILLIIVGSKVVYNDRFVTITGTIAMPEANDSLLTGSIDITYPNGFNSENCIIISLMSHNTLHTDWWCTTTNTKNVSAGIAGSGDLTARLKPAGITVSSNKVAVEENRKDVTFKITLMKLSN